MQVEDVLADLIRIKTVNPPGGETEVAKYLKGLFDQYGIPNEVIEPSPGRGSFLAYLGEGEKGLLYLSHTDVVTTKEEDWSFDPFSGEIKNRFILGRGAIDCKGLVAAEACAAIQLAEEGNLKGRLIFTAAADEETQGPLGVDYLIKNHSDKIRADFAINEGGQVIKINDRICHFISTGEKGLIWTKLKANGTASHGCLPGLGDNAITRMIEVIRSIYTYKPQILLIPEVKKLIQALVELTDFRDEISEGNVDLFIQEVKDKNLAAYLSAITRMTVSPNVIHGGMKTNIVPDSCEADIDIRILPGQDKNYVIEKLPEIVNSLEMEIIRYVLPNFSPSNSEYYQLIDNTLQKFVGNDLILPSVTAGTTDSRYLREIGIPSYGIGMITLNADPALMRSIHGKDEKIDIDSLRLKTDFLVALAKKYLGE
ncbi:MAG: M20/M25/M40 family metallo-hydrolase [Candidatus Bathyarchaeota archaeon]